MHTRYSQVFQYEPTLLYRIVFGARWVRFAAVLLFLFFTIHPATQAFGAEDVVVEENVQEQETEDVPKVEENVTEVPEESVTAEELESTQTEETPEDSTTEEGTPDGAEFDVSDTEVLQESEVDSAEVPVSVADEVPVVVQDGTDPVDPVRASSSENVFSEEVLGVATTTNSIDAQQEENIDTEVPASSEQDVVEGQDGIEGQGVVAQEDTEVQEVIVQEDAEKAQEKSSEDTSDPNEERVVEDSAEADTVVPAPEYFEIDNEVSHSDAHYQFQKTQCVSMGDGGYYCAKKQLMDPVMTQADSLYAALDAQGDMEIYLRSNGNTQQITDNTYDDAAPYYDPVSDSIVWHRLIKGRYQIMNFEAGEEEQLTQSNNNSMEPKRSGDYVVWQEWVDSNWEVMLYDGQVVEQLTQSAMHDIAPYVQGGHVIWTTTDGEAPVVSVYDIATKRTSTIEDSDGGRVENPRFVLVYDEKLDNGDIITKGFNPDTGEVAPLSAQAGTVPTELPSSDSTGETRALIQNKPGAREDFSEEIALGSSTTTDTVATSSDDVLVSAVELVESNESEESDGQVAQIATTSPEILPLTDFDIIVEPFSATTSAQESDTATSTDAVE